MPLFWFKLVDSYTRKSFDVKKVDQLKVKLLTSFFSQLLWSIGLKLTKFTLPSSSQEHFYLHNPTLNTNM